MESGVSYIKFKHINFLKDKERFIQFLNFLKDGCKQLNLFSYGTILIEYDKKYKSFKLFLEFNKDISDIDMFNFLKKWSGGLASLVVDSGYSLMGCEDFNKSRIWFFSEKEHNFESQKEN